RLPWHHAGGAAFYSTWGKGPVCFCWLVPTVTVARCPRFMPEVEGIPGPTEKRIPAMNNEARPHKKRPGASRGTPQVRWASSGPGPSGATKRRPKDNNLFHFTL